ncbi:MAG: TIGR00725 family protein [Deltaproteobacteria bacterium]|nr:TIGR00725 family protein [Deltaproteobacteria bacterium]
MGSRKPLIGIIGASKPKNNDLSYALEVGQRVASNGWIVICGGLEGVMEAVSRGASEKGGVVVGILPRGKASEANRYVTIPIATNMGYARNAIIAQASDTLIAIGGGPGTLSEIGHSLAFKKLVVGLETWQIPGVIQCRTPAEAVSLIEKHLKKSGLI